MKHNILAMILAGACAFGAAAADPSNLKIYINPGHGGHEGNDRNVVIPPFAQGDPNGYWESNSNLEKALALRDMLEAKGFTVVLSRVTNTEDDDLNLSTIVALSNASHADLFFSIHSNATGVSARRNFPLILFRGYDNDPIKPQDKVVGTILNQHLLKNQVTYWTATNINVRGDFTFYPAWNNAGLGVLRGNNVTGVLSEGSFHDYIPETYRLMNRDFCWLEAYHFRKCIEEYLEVEGNADGHIMGRINDTRVPREGDFLMFGEDKFATVQGVKVELYNAAGELVDVYTTESHVFNGVYAFHNLQPGTYTIKASVDTHYPVEATVEVKADEVAYANLKMSKIRSTPPTVEAYTPQWNQGDAGVLCNSPVTIQFNWDMDTELTEQAFSIEPPIEGTFTWEDLNYRMVFTPTRAYDISTEYTVTLGTGATHAGGMPMEQPFSFSFMTSDRNFMDILGHYPSQDDEVHYHGAMIEFRFDKLPNVTPILTQVTCTDSHGNPVSFNKRGLSNSKVGAAYGFFRIPFSQDLTIGETYNLHLSGDFSDKDGITIQGPVDVTFRAVDAGTAKEGDVLCAMAADDVLTVSTEGSTGMTSATVSDDKKEYLFGTSSKSFSYVLSAEQDAEVLWQRQAGDADLMVGADNRIGLHVYGDLTANELYLEFTSDISTRYVKVCDMTFLGWRYIELPLDQLEAPSHLTGVKLVQRASQMSQTGTFRLDEVVVANTGGVNDVESATGIVLTYSAGNPYIVANAGTLITSMTLTDMQGRMVAGTSGNALRVADLPAGAYIVTASTSSATISQKIIIK